MKYLTRSTLFIGLGIALSLGNFANAQSSLSSAMGVTVFPAEGQDSTQQSMDEADCYSWAEEDSGVDPFELQKQQDAKDQQTDEQIAAAEAAQAIEGFRPCFTTVNVRTVGQMNIVKESHQLIVFITKLHASRSRKNLETRILVSVDIFLVFLVDL